MIVNLRSSRLFSSVQVLCEAMVERFPQILMDWADKLQVVQKAEMAALHKEVMAKTSDLAVLESKLKADQDLREQERWSYERSLADQAKLAAQNDEHLKAMVRWRVMLCLSCCHGYRLEVAVVLAVTVVATVATVAAFFHCTASERCYARYVP